MPNITDRPSLAPSEELPAVLESGGVGVPSRRESPLPVISLFCGCGGFDLGFENAGFAVPLAYDANPVVVQTYNHNRRNPSTGVVPSTACVADLLIKTGEQIIEDFERLGTGQSPRGVIGGAPCQTFSMGNKHFKPDDPRHLLPRHYAEVLTTLNEFYKLDFFVFENVLGIKSRKHKETFAHFKSLFELAGFRLFEGQLDAKDFGVAQKRPRVFIVGLNKEVFPEVEFAFPRALTPDGCHSQRRVKHVINPLHLGDPQFFCRTLTPEVVRGRANHPNHWTMNPKSPKFHDGTLMNGAIRGRSFRRVEWEDFSDAVAYGHNEVHIHPSGTRRLSVLEAMLLQGLPFSYELTGSLSQQISQISDAIPPQLGEALGRAVAQFLATAPRRREEV